MEQMESERLVEQDLVYQHDNELMSEQKKKFDMEMEIEKYARKVGKQPRKKQVKQQQPLTK